MRDLPAARLQRMQCGQGRQARYAFRASRYETHLATATARSIVFPQKKYLIFIQFPFNR